MRDEFRAVRAEMRAESASLRSEMREEFAAMRSETKGGFDGVHDRLDRMQQTMIASSSLVIVALIGLIATQL